MGRVDRREIETDKSGTGDCASGVQSGYTDLHIDCSGVKLLKDRDPMARVAYRVKRHSHAIPLTLHNNVCLGESPKRWETPKIVYGC